jgi:RNA polymerase sigma factor (sigma-70 family)
VRDLDEAYRIYAPRLLAYCTALLRDRHAAADAVQDTFIAAAAKQHQLRDPARFEAWLYAIARNNCKAHLRVRAQQLTIDLDSVPAGTPDDPAEGVRAQEVRELVHSAAGALSEADREIIELAIRHSLSPTALSTVLGLPANHVHARLSRARVQLEKAIGALLVARDGSSADPSTHCPLLAELLRDWDGRLDPLTRTRNSRHIEDCERCSARRSVLASPAALLPAYAAPPFAAASTMDPMRLIPARPRRRTSKVAVPAVLAVAVIGGVLAFGQCGRPVSSADPTALTVVPSELPSPQAAKGSPPQPGVKAPSSAKPPAPPPSSSPKPPPAAPFTVAVSERSATCTTASNTYKLHVEIATSTPFSSARLHWIEGSWPRHSLPITATGARTGEVTKVLLKEPTDWWVEAVAADGRTARTETAFVRSPCL